MASYNVVVRILAGAVNMISGRRNRLIRVLKSDSAATDLDPVSNLKAILDA